MENFITSKPLLRPLLIVFPYAKCMMMAVAVSLLLGAGLSGYFPQVSAGQGAVWMLLIAGSGWALSAVLALFFLGEKRFDYIHNMGDVKQTGVLTLMPLAVSMAVWHGMPVWLVGAWFVLAAALMLEKHLRLMRIVGIPTAWNWVWMASVLGASSLFAYVFNIVMLQG